MTKTTLNVLFKKIQKDDQKEVLKFEYKGKDNKGDNEEDNKSVQAPVALYGLSGEIVNLKVGETEWVTAEFSKLNKDSKKVTLDFALKGDSEAKALELYKVAGHNVQLTVEPQQSDLTEELPAAKEEPHKGVEYELDLTTGQAATKSKLEEQPKQQSAEEQLKELKKEPADPEDFGDPDALPDDDGLPF